MISKSKLEVVLSLRRLEEDISKARLASGLKRLEADRQAVGRSMKALEAVRQRWREATAAAESTQQLKLFPSHHDGMKARLEEESSSLEEKSKEVEQHREDYITRNRARTLLEGVVARQNRRKALIQEAREQDERDEQMLLHGWSS